METHNNIQNKIDEVLNASESIEKVNVSPFFKDKTLDRLFTKQEVRQKSAFTWFSPQLQLATLACVVILNVMALTKLKESTYNENVSQFAESYGLSTPTETSLFN